MSTASQAVFNWIPAFAHCCPEKFLIGSTGSYEATKRFKLACRHSREGGGAFQQRSWSIHLVFCTRATWIPAFAGMTARNHGVLRKIKSLTEKKNEAQASSAPSAGRQDFSRTAVGLRRDDEQKH